ncbi:hypothetical protein SDJN02_10478, partial [Cucurbita argyrosperma subsp. argyrosperma]
HFALDSFSSRVWIMRNFGEVNDLDGPSGSVHCVFRIVFAFVLVELENRIKMPWTSSFVNYSSKCVRLVVFFRVIL